MEKLSKLLDSINNFLSTQGKVTALIAIIFLGFGYYVYESKKEFNILLDVINNQPVAITEHQEDLHALKIQRRMEISPKINEYIKRVLDDTKVDRVFIAEYHNGQENLCGLPFSRFSITYEVDRELDNGSMMIPLKGSFNNLNLSMFSFPTTLSEDSPIFYEMDMISKEDPVLYTMLQKSDDKLKYLYLSQIESATLPIGFIGVTSENHLTNLQVAKIMMAAHSLSEKLSYNKYPIKK